MPKQVDLHSGSFRLSFCHTGALNPSTPEARENILLATAIAAAGLIHVSIAASQVMLGIGIALMLIIRRRLEFPRIWVPLALLIIWTVAADLLSPDPWGGRAQIRKFFV